MNAKKVKALRAKFPKTPTTYLEGTGIEPMYQQMLGRLFPMKVSKGKPLRLSPDCSRALIKRAKQAA